MIITITLSDGTEIEGDVKDMIKTGDFFNFESVDRETGKPITVRVETTINYEDRKRRGC